MSIIYVNLEKKGKESLRLPPITPEVDAGKFTKNILLTILSESFILIIEYLLKIHGNNEISSKLKFR